MLSARNAGVGEAPNVTAPTRCCSTSRVIPAGLNFPVNPPLWDEEFEAVCVPQASMERHIRALEARMRRSLDRSAASGERCSWLMLTQRQGGLLWRVFQFVACERARGPRRRTAAFGSMTKTRQVDQRRGRVRENALARCVPITTRRR